MSHHSGRWSFFKKQFLTKLADDLLVNRADWKKQIFPSWNELKDHTTRKKLFEIGKQQKQQQQLQRQRRQQPQPQQHNNNSKISSWKRTRRRLAKPRVQISVRSSPSKLHRDFRQIFFSCWRIKLIDIETISTFQSKPAFSSNVSLSAVAQLSIKEKGSGGGASGRAMVILSVQARFESRERLGLFGSELLFIYSDWASDFQ